jgi:hypothetical protein
MQSNGQTDKWLIFDHDDGTLLNAAQTCYGTFRVLDELWGKGNWRAFHPDDRNLTQPVPRASIKKTGFSGPYQAFPTPDALEHVAAHHPQAGHLRHLLVLPRDHPDVARISRDDLTNLHLVLPDTPDTSATDGDNS